ncbi:MAG: alpha/beta hydrolase family protein [Hyphomicrobiaceae bacterium]
MTTISRITCATMVTSLALGWAISVPALASGQPHGAATPATGISQDKPAQPQKRPPQLVTALSETVVEVPVTLGLVDGRTVTANMVITHFKPEGAGPFPAVILNHGRSASNRQTPPRVRMLPLVRFWARRGFAVVVPTRVGYGALGQAIDPEWGGPCSRADFKPVIEAMAVQGAAAAEFAARLAHVDGTRILMTGISYGGIGALAAAAKSVPGVIGAINFVGGVGGRPERHVHDPCQPHPVAGIIAGLGARSRVPTLWLYSKNDRYWGEDWPQRWYQAFKAAGGSAELALLPPVDSDGHKLASRGFPLWRPVVDRFIARLGFEVPSAHSPLPASGYAQLDDIEKVPHITEASRIRGYSQFLKADVPRAFALAPSGAWSWRRGPKAADEALANCRKRAHMPCRLYAVDDRVVWKGDSQVSDVPASR